jgi:hypothetical protein
MSEYISQLMKKKIKIKRKEAKKGEREGIFVFVIRSTMLPGT